MPSALTWRARKNRRKRGKEIDLRRWSQYQDPPRRLRLGPGDSPCRGWMLILRASRGTSAESDRSPAVSLIRRLQGGSELSSDLPLDPPRAIVATRPQSWTRCGRFRTHGRKCPRQCWRQRLGIWDVSNYLGPGPSLERCGGRYRIFHGIFGEITISIPTGRTGHAERNSCAMWWLGEWRAGCCGSLVVWSS